jgi:hypothetical protein
VKDSTKFAKGFNDLTAACNARHKAIGRGLIADRLAFQQSIVFAAYQPFSNQSFSPPTKQ